MVGATDLFLARRFAFTSFFLSSVVLPDLPSIIAPTQLYTRCMRQGDIWTIGRQGNGAVTGW